MVIKLQQRLWVSLHIIVLVSKSLWAQTSLKHDHKMFTFKNTEMNTTFEACTKHEPTKPINGVGGNGRWAENMSGYMNRECCVLEPSGSKQHLVRAKEPKTNCARNTHNTTTYLSQAVGTTGDTSTEYTNNIWTPKWMCVCKIEFSKVHAKTKHTCFILSFKYLLSPQKVYVHVSTANCDL